MDILKTITNKLTSNITEAGFEGANIVLYTDNENFFKSGERQIKEIVNEVKKRIELRADQKILLNSEKTEKEIRQIVPEEAELVNIIFDVHRSIVVIEAKKPGMVIGKQGSILEEIRTKTMWTPQVQRAPAIKSKITESIREVLYANNNYRRKFLNDIGKKIYNEWNPERADAWVRLTFLGSARQVGRSCLLLQTPSSKVLLDCGINVAAKGTERFPDFNIPEFNISQLDAVILSHAHIDHSGLIPYLYKMGYRGPVYMTTPTRDISSLLALDFIGVAYKQASKPLFGSKDVRDMVKHSVCLNFNEVTDVTPDIRITLYNAGHILGSAMVHLHVGNGLHNLLYSADMKFGKSIMLSPAAVQFPRLETMLLESTYGGKDNILPSKKEMYDYLRDIVNDTLARKGKILIPVLGSGRAQDIMIMLEELSRTKQIKKTDIFIDGLIWDITAIHTAYPEYLNSAMRKQIFHKDNNPFLSDIFKRIGSGKERKELIEEKSSCIILATSGMLVGGPSVEYLKAMADNSKNSLVFSSYQGEGSLGRRIRNGEREIVFREGQKNEICQIKMEVHKVEISDHSDRKELMNYISRCSPRPKRILINHGEKSRSLDLASSLHKTYRLETSVPWNLDAVRIK